MTDDKITFKGTGVYKLDANGLYKKIPKRELKAMKEQAEEDKAKLIEAILDHFNLPYRGRADVEKYRAAIYHYMTCTYPNHAHDVVQAEWPAPTTTNNFREM